MIAGVASLFVDLRGATRKLRDENTSSGCFRAPARVRTGSAITRTSAPRVKSTAPHAGRVAQWESARFTARKVAGSSPAVPIGKALLISATKPLRRRTLARAGRKRPPKNSGRGLTNGVKPLWHHSAVSGVPAVVRELLDGQIEIALLDVERPAAIVALPDA